MAENFNQQTEPPAELFNKVLCRIQHEQRKARAKKAAFFSFGIFSSVFVFIPILISTISEIRRSGLAYIISLIFSDFQAVVSVWDDFLLSVLETLPIINIAILFGSIYVFLGTIRYLAKYTYLPRIFLRTVK